MAEEEEKKKETEDEDSIWKSIVEEVKKQGTPVREKSIEVSEERPKEVRSLSKKPIEKVSGELAPKYDIKPKESIEKPSIEGPIGTSIEKSIEGVPEKEETKKITPKKEAEKPVKIPSKFTTIMITRELKEKLAKEKEPKESYGKFIKRLLENR